MRTRQRARITAGGASVSPVLGQLQLIGVEAPLEAVIDLWPLKNAKKPIHRVCLTISAVLALTAAVMATVIYDDAATMIRNDGRNKDALLGPEVAENTGVCQVSRKGCTVTTAGSDVCFTATNIPGDRCVPFSETNEGRNPQLATGLLHGHTWDPTTNVKGACRDNDANDEPIECTETNNACDMKNTGNVCMLDTTNQHQCDVNQVRQEFYTAGNAIRNRLRCVQIGAPVPTMTDAEVRRLPFHKARYSIKSVTYRDGLPFEDLDVCFPNGECERGYRCHYIRDRRTLCADKEADDTRECFCNGLNMHKTINVEADVEADGQGVIGKYTSTFPEGSFDMSRVGRCEDDLLIHCTEANKNDVCPDGAKACVTFDQEMTKAGCTASDSTAAGTCNAMSVCSKDKDGVVVDATTPLEKLTFCKGDAACIEVTSGDTCGGATVPPRFKKGTFGGSCVVLDSAHGGSYVPRFAATATDLSGDGEGEFGARRLSTRARTQHKHHGAVAVRNHLEAKHPDSSIEPSGLIWADGSDSATLDWTNGQRLYQQLWGVSAEEKMLYGQAGPAYLLLIASWVDVALMVMIFAYDTYKAPPPSPPPANPQGGDETDQGPRRNMWRRGLDQTNRYIQSLQDAEKRFEIKNGVYAMLVVLRNIAEIISIVSASLLFVRARNNDSLDFSTGVNEAWFSAGCYDGGTMPAGVGTMDNHAKHPEFVAATAFLVQNVLLVVAAKLVISRVVGTTLYDLERWRDDENKGDEPRLQI